LQISKRLAFICEQENIKAAPEALSIISEKADGSMRDALTIFDEVFAYSRREITHESVRNALGIPSDTLYFELMQAFEAHDAKESFAVLERAVSGGAEVHVFLSGFTRFLRNLLYSRLGLSAEQLEISQEALDNFKSVSLSFEQGDILRMAKIITDLREKCSNRHGLNPRLLAEAEFSKIAWLDRVADINKVLQSLHGKVLQDANVKVPLKEESQKKIGGSTGSSAGNAYDKGEFKLSL
jgi:DNA polymerase-3 subunit gamma/tau